MAGDLKDFLKKVLASKGEKKFFFAYGAGKRKDKKGEGELAVRGKKPKKAEVEAELLDADDVFEGACWIGNRPENGETVYFQAKGKKLSNAIVTKMIKTAKLTTGKQYDFQIPSAEEEARAAGLPEGEEDQGPAAVLPPAPQPGAAVPTPPAPQPGAAVPTPPALAGAAVIKRLNALAGGIKTALAGPNKARVQTLFVSVNGLIKKSAFVQADKVLDELEPLLKPAQAAAPPPTGQQAPTDAAALQAEWERMVLALEPKIFEANKTRAGEAKWMKLFRSAQDLGSDGEFDKALQILNKLEELLKAKGAAPTGGAAADALRAQWDARFAELDPRYQAVLKTQPANAGDLRAAMTSANVAAEKGDFARALMALTRLEALLETAKTLGKETDVIPEGIVKQRVEQLEKAAERWHEVHFQSIEGLESLMQQLRADSDPDLHEIAARVDLLTKGIPAEIEASLAKLSAAVRAADAGEAAKWVDQVQLGVNKCEGFLQDNLPYIERCEENPFDLPVIIQKPLRESLANIRASLATL
jgi:hypothetical protein